MCYNDFVNRTTKFILLTALCLSLTIGSPKIAEAGRINISATIAIGGVVGGIYYFVSLTLADTSALQPIQRETGALLNHGQKGWKIGCPRLKLVEDGRFGYAPYVDILTFRF
ncbi:MAG: hypothetical protein HWN68_10745 [Desulfobacterales bacterium]|nr:hypothetical protein [Desulfobacterales bacterium]